MAEERVAFDLATQEFVANYDELLEQYPDQWIAVMMNPGEGRTVLSSADSMSFAERSKVVGSPWVGRIYATWRNNHASGSGRTFPW